MEIKTLDDNFLVTAQITIEDLDEIKANGIKTIICNRPDGEADNQPSHSEIKTKAAELGIDFLYIPIEKAPAQAPQINAFKTAYDEGLEQPILAYCRSGMRSTTMWASANVQNYSKSEILDKASAAGYELNLSDISNVNLTIHHQ